MGHITAPFAAVGRYMRQTVAELKKTVTPTVREWVGWTLAALILVLLLMAAVSGMDYGLGRLTLEVFG